MIKLKELGGRGEPIIVQMYAGDLVSLIDGCTVAHLHLHDAAEKANARSGAQVGDTLYAGRAKDAKANVQELQRILDAWSENMDALNRAEDAEYRLQRESEAGMLRGQMP